MPLFAEYARIADTNIDDMDLNKAVVGLYKQRQDKANGEDVPVKRPKQDSPPKTTFDSLYGIDQVKEEILDIVYLFQRYLCGPTSVKSSPTLVSGSRGLGKTSLVEAAANHAKLVLITIPLKLLVLQTRNEFKVSLNQMIASAVAQQPAMVLFDDLEEVSDKEDLRGLVKASIIKMLPLKLLTFCTTSSVLSDTQDFVFKINLKRPDIDARLSILRLLRDSDKYLSELSDENLKTLAIDCSSFRPPDLENMLVLARAKSRGSPKLQDCVVAAGVIRQSFQTGTHLIGQRPTVTWRQIGGLPKVKSKFNNIIANLNNGTLNCKFAGIALYGPPGCGKTMVAQAMANEAGLNFISIKPAELIDKFLGETEKNIRRVFWEAREHQPCLIYFDEFDGLCGSRGRREKLHLAVETLLSEMDGFEGRGQSIILASTNRLEDIDPAMKRPGRLSEHIYVGPPDEEARMEILRILTSRTHLSLASDISIESIAKQTRGFTGADLHFLIDKAVNKAQGQLDDSMAGSGIVLRQEHIDNALKSKKITRTVKTRPISKKKSIVM